MSHEAAVPPRVSTWDRREATGSSPVHQHPARGRKGPAGTRPFPVTFFSRCQMDRLVACVPPTFVHAWEA